MAEQGHREFTLSERDFRFIAQLITGMTGIVVSDHKREMVTGRLVKRLRALDLPDFSDYCDLVKGPDGRQEIEHLVNALTTNITQFFREPHHFTHLRTKVLEPRRTEKVRRPRLRIWSAGCSSGQEPYTIAMILAETLRPMAGWDALVLATDIDTNMLARARDGYYSHDEAATIPPNYRKRFIRRCPGDHSRMRMDDDLRRLIRFKPLNLLGTWPMKGPFDAIFCRNVAIYFDKMTQHRLFNRFADILAPGGMLYLGHAESLIGLNDRFEMSDKTVYRRI